MNKGCKLVILDAGPIIKLAVVRQLDLLFSFGLTVIIPDEVLFEAAEKKSWLDGSDPAPDKVYLKDWVTKYKGSGHVIERETFIGTSTKDGRESGKLTPANYPDHIGELAADSVFLDRANIGFGNDPAVVLIDDYAAIDMFRAKNSDVFIYTTWSFLLQLEIEDQLSSVNKTADAIWADIIVELPTSSKMLDPDPTGPVRKGTSVKFKPK